MGATKHIKMCMIDKKIKSGEIAAKMGAIPQTFYNKLTRDTMRFSEVEEIAAALGCDVVLIDRETGKTY